MTICRQPRDLINFVAILNYLNIIIKSFINNIGNILNFVYNQLSKNKLDRPNRLIIKINLLILSTYN